MARDPEAIIVGAGLAGLAAGVDLAEQGIKVLVLEKRETLGGRASSFKDPKTGQSVDNGQHLFMGCYTQTLEFFNKIQALDKLEFQKTLLLNYFEPGGRQSHLACPNLPAPLHLLWGLLSFKPLTFFSKVAVFRAGSKLSRGNTGSAKTVREWLEQEKQPQATRKYFWEPLVLATLNTGLQRASVRLLATVLKAGVMAGGKYSRLGFARTGLSQLYAEGAKKFIEDRGGRVESKASVQNFVVSKSRVVGIKMYGGRVLPCPAVISSVTPHDLRSLLPVSLQTSGQPFHYLKGLHSSAILSVHLWLDREAVPLEWAGMLGTSVQWIFNKKRMFRQAEGDYLSLVISDADKFMRMKSSDIAALAVKDLQKVFSSARGARVLRHWVVKEPFATLSADPKVQALRPGCRTNLKNLFLAGDWTDTGLPATMESAVKSGRIAAKAVMDR